MRKTIISLLIGLILGSGCGESVPPEKVEIERDGRKLELLAEKARPDRFLFRVRDVTNSNKWGETPYLIAIDADFELEMPSYYEPFNFELMEAHDVPENHPILKYFNHKEMVELYQEYRARIEKDDVGIER